MNIDDLEKENIGYDPVNDKLNFIDKKKSAGPILTLRHINKLRKMAEFRKYERSAREKLFGVMYGQVGNGDENSFM